MRCLDFESKADLPMIENIGIRSKQWNCDIVFPVYIDESWFTSRKWEDFPLAEEKKNAKAAEKQAEVRAEKAVEEVEVTVRDGRYAGLT